MAGAIEDLIKSDPFGSDSSLFERAMLECFSFHYENCMFYRNFCGKRANKLEEIPWMLVTALKHYPMLSTDDAVLTLTSSGTSGQKTEISLNEASLNNLRTIAEKIYGGMGLVDKREEVNYLCFTYDPEYARDVGTAWSDKNNLSFTGVNEVFYALKWNGKSFYFDRKGAIEQLRRYSLEDLPVRILGFPAYIAETLAGFRESCGRVDLGEKSFVLPGGGWKGKKGEMPKDLFRGMIRDVTGIPEENVRDCYGLAEHGIPYVECEYGNMHVPLYSEAEVIDPLTLKVCSHGEKGLLHLMSPYNLTSPYLSILTTDYGTMEENCPCGMGRPYIDIAGRAGIKKHLGCAVSALQYM